MFSPLKHGVPLALTLIKLLFFTHRMFYVPCMIQHSPVGLCVEKQHVFYNAEAKFLNIIQIIPVSMCPAITSNYSNTFIFHTTLTRRMSGQSLRIPVF
jgi:hypothetical protein